MENSFADALTPKVTIQWGNNTSVFMTKAYQAWKHIIILNGELSMCRFFTAIYNCLSSLIGYSHRCRCR